VASATNTTRAGTETNAAITGATVESHVDGADESAAGGGIIAFAQHIVRLGARWTYVLLFILLAVLVTMEIVRRRRARKEQTEEMEIPHE